MTIPGSLSRSARQFMPFKKTIGGNGTMSNRISVSTTTEFTNYRGHRIERQAVSHRLKPCFKVCGDNWWNNVALDTIREAKALIDAWEDRKTIRDTDAIDALPAID